MQNQLPEKRLYNIIGKGAFFFNTGAILAALLLIVVIEFCAVLNPNSEITTTGGWLLVINAVAVYGIAPLILWRIIRKIPIYEGTISPLRKDLPPAAETAIVTVVAIGIPYIVNLISSWIERIAEQGANIELNDPIEVTAADSPQVLWFLSVVIVAPVVEELVFRKMLLTRMRWAGDRAALILSSAFFAVFHGNLQQAAYAFPMGLVIGYLMLRTGNVLYPIICHTCCNLVTGILIPALSESHDIISSMIIFCIVTTTVVCFAICRTHIRTYFQEAHAEHAAVNAPSSEQASRASIRSKWYQSGWMMAYIICGMGYCFIGTIIA